jgi:acetyl esterase/lipase
LTVCALFLCADNSVWAKTEYPTTAANPSFAMVTELSYVSARHKVPYGEDPNQFGLLWSSTANRDDVLIVFIHGGCWLSAYDIVHTYPAATAIFDAGFNVWNLEYRRTGETGGGWPTTYEDIKSGLAHILSLSEHGIKPNHIIIAGHSAGGHLSLLAGRDVQKILPNKQSVDVIGLAAITDLERYASGDNGCQKAGLSFMGSDAAEDQESYDSANPSKHDIPTTINLLHGESDAIVPIDQMADFKQLKLIKHPVVDAGHFDWVHPGTPAFTHFLTLLRALTETASAGS